MQWKWAFDRIFEAFFGALSTWTLSPSGADAESHPRCWATRDRGQCTGNGPLDSFTVDGIGMYSHVVDIHTVKESDNNNDDDDNDNDNDKDNRRCFLGSHEYSFCTESSYPYKATDGKFLEYSSGGALHGRAH